MGPRHQTLIFIADHAQVVMPSRQMLHQQILRAIGVLIFIHQQVLESRAINGLHGVFTEQPFGVKQQIIEITGPMVAQAFLVKRVGVQHLTGPGIDGFFHRFFRKQAAVLEIGNHLQHTARMELFFGHFQFRQHLLHQAFLIRWIKDHEVAAHWRAIALATQNARAKRVEGAHPKLRHGNRNKLCHPVPHFFGGLVGEGHGQDGAGVRTLLLDEPRDAPRDDRGLARPSAREDQQRPFRMHDGFPLGRVQILQQRMVGGGLGHF